MVQIIKIECSNNDYQIRRYRDIGTYFMEIMSCFKLEPRIKINK